jgi:hypothetical protein
MILPREGHNHLVMQPLNTQREMEWQFFELRTTATMVLPILTVLKSGEIIEVIPVVLAERHRISLFMDQSGWSSEVLKPPESGRIRGLGTFSPVEVAFLSSPLLRLPGVGGQLRR